MIYVGIDDTDTLDSPGTNQLAKAIARLLADDFACHSIVRHQLFFDPRVPYTSKNGSASIVLEPRGDFELTNLIDRIRGCMLEWFVSGSDPGLCLTTMVPSEITAFGERAKRDLVAQAEARTLAARHGILLEGLGGTEGGVIGALAAVGLIVTGDDGRIVHWGAWPDDLSGDTPLELLRERGLSVRHIETQIELTAGLVDVGKHLRPNLRGGRAVLFVEPCDNAWRAVKLV